MCAAAAAAAPVADIQWFGTAESGSAAEQKQVVGGPVRYGTEELEYIIVREGSEATTTSHWVDKEGKLVPEGAQGAEKRIELGSPMVHAEGEVAYADIT